MGLFGSLFGGKRKGGIGAYADPRRTMQDEMENPYKQRGGGFFSQDTADKLGGLASGLAQAQAYGDGDWSEAEAIGQNRTAARQAANEAAAKQQQLRMIYESLIANGMKPGDAQVIAADPSKAGGFITDRYKPPEAPGIAKNFEWYKSLTPDQQNEFSGYQDIVNPQVFQGADGRQYVRPRVPTQPVGELTPIDEPTTPAPPNMRGTNVVSRQDAERVRQSLIGVPGGEQKYQDWLRQNNIVIGN